MRVEFGGVVAIAAATLLAAACFVPASFAGEGNVLYLLQDSSQSTGTGQSFQSDQHLSINSSIGTSLQAATQSGEDNSASITIDSTCAIVSTDCGHAALTQSDDYKGALAGSDLTGLQKVAVGAVLGYVATNFGGNSANVSVTGGGTGSVTQYGFGNTANLSATDASGSINQIGLGNTASLTVNPLGLSGGATPGSVTLNQFGLNNAADLVVLAAAGTSSSYTQIGSNDSYKPAAPISITTNNSVDVTRYHFGF